MLLRLQERSRLKIITSNRHSKSSHHRYIISSKTIEYLTVPKNYLIICIVTMDYLATKAFMLSIERQIRTSCHR